MRRHILCTYPRRVAQRHHVSYGIDPNGVDGRAGTELHVDRCRWRRTDSLDEECGHPVRPDARSRRYGDPLRTPMSTEPGALPWPRTMKTKGRVDAAVSPTAVKAKEVYSGTAMVGAVSQASRCGAFSEKTCSLA
jgi:hypothetical protein